jgi:hypothetical protein
MREMAAMGLPTGSAMACWKNWQQGPHSDIPGVQRRHLKASVGDYVWMYICLLCNSAAVSRSPSRICLRFLPIGENTLFLL